MQRPNLVSADGTTDVMAYDRLCDLVQAGVASVSAVRTAAAFQMPYADAGRALEGKKENLSKKCWKPAARFKGEGFQVP